MSHPKMILVAGPTASGKSAFALDLARQHHGTIINADAMQIYAGLPILSAQPDAAAIKEIPHKLYGAIDPSERSSVGRWLGLAQQAIRETLAEDRTPILVGGTGLYFRALLQGLAEIPPIPESVRNAVTHLYDTLGEAAFRRDLARLDPATESRLARNDRQRLIRAYEVVTHTGRPLGEWHGEGLGAGASSGLGGKSTLIPHLLMPPREELYAACNQRFLSMLERGALEEVRVFRERGLTPDLPAAKTIGLRELTSFIEGKTSREESIADAQQATRNYAKRQMTWFRNQWQGMIA